MGFDKIKKKPHLKGNKTSKPEKAFSKKPFRKDQKRVSQKAAFGQQTEPVTEERIAKRLARIGIASRREAELMIEAGRISVDGKVVKSVALNIKRDAVLSLDGKILPQPERTRLWLYHKPKGLVTTTNDPEGRPTVFSNLPTSLPRVLSIGRLDINTEGLLLLTNDGGLKRILELPTIGWTRCYRVRAFGKITQEALDSLKNGIAVQGIFYGPIEAAIEREQGANLWLTLSLREGKNREVKNILDALGLTVNRLIRVSYGPFQLHELAAGEVQEVKSRTLQEQLGARLIEKANADFDSPILNPFPVKKPQRQLPDEGSLQGTGRLRAGNVWFGAGARSYMRLKTNGDETALNEKKAVKLKSSARKGRKFGKPTASKPANFRKRSRKMAKDAHYSW